MSWEGRNRNVYSSTRSEVRLQLRHVSQSDTPASPGVKLGDYSKHLLKLLFLPDKASAFTAQLARHVRTLRVQSKVGPPLTGSPRPRAKHLQSQTCRNLSASSIPRHDSIEANWALQADALKKKSAVGLKAPRGLRRLISPLRA